MLTTVTKFHRIRAFTIDDVRKLTGETVSPHTLRYAKQIVTVAEKEYGVDHLNRKAFLWIWWKRRNPHGKTNALYWGGHQTAIGQAFISQSALRAVFTAAEFHATSTYPDLCFGHQDCIARNVEVAGRSIQHQQLLKDIDTWVKMNGVS